MATLRPSDDFVLPQVMIHFPEDVGRLVEVCLGGHFRPGELRRHFCPWHPNLDRPTLTIPEAPGTTTLIHCSECAYRRTALEWLNALVNDDEQGERI